MPYTVFVDDNYRYSDEDERYRHGEFKTAAEAVEACKRIVERSPIEAYEPGASAEQLMGRYRMFGEDPFIAGDAGEAAVQFSAWTYAEERCPAFIAEREQAHN